MNIQEIRLKNLAILVKEFGAISALAKACGTPPNYLSQILNGVESSPGRPRGVGHILAEKLELAAGKPRGWIDSNNHDNNAGAKIAAIYNELPDEMKLNLMEFAEHLQEKNKKSIDEVVLDKLYGHAKPILPPKNKKLFIKN